MSVKQELKNKILKEYKSLKKHFFKNQFSHSKLLTLCLDNRKYMVMIDPGFGFTIVTTRTDIKILRYLLNQDYYDFGISPAYFFIGEIMSFKDDNYSLNIYRKKPDSYFEEPSLGELKLLQFIIDALYPCLKYYTDNLVTVEQNAEFVFYFDDENKEVSLKAYEFPEYSYFDGKVKAQVSLKPEPNNDSLTLIDMFPIELPIFSTERKKLINPYVLTVYSENTHKRKFYLIPEETNNAYDKAIEILNSTTLGSNLCITNALLYQAIKPDKALAYKINFEPLQYYRLNDFFTIEYNFYKYNSSKDHFFIDYDVLCDFYEKLNKCYSFVDETFDNDSYDESLFKSLNPEVYEFFNKYIINHDDEYILFESCLFNNQLFGNLYPFKELLELENEEIKGEQNDDFDVTEDSLAS